ncbi:MAG TPA: zf-TFIIB domain-containing protein [Candidatus Binatia bacterium]|nr:zf-TFIIB domain-containing protein [Candidatus Binatia bacterium]
MVRCPSCDREMKEVTVRANPGTLIVLDQCERCGGIWCDKWELFPIDPEEALTLETLDEERLRALTPSSKKQLFCPRCTGQLELFSEPLLPPDIQLQRCRHCEGIWLNHGQFSRYKSHQQKTRTKKLGKAATVRKIAEVYEDPKSWVTTGTQGIFAHPRAAESASDVSEPTVRGAFKTILQVLLRTVLGI